MRAHLHSAFDQLYGRDNKGDYQSSKKSILEALYITKFTLAPDGLVQLIRAEADGTDHGGSYEGIVYSAK